MGVQGEAAVTFLMADDDPDDRLLAQQALREYLPADGMKFVSDGVELLNYLRRHGPYADPASSPRPAVILLDLNMPHQDGRQALAEIKADLNLRRIPVVVMTTSKAQEDVFNSYDLGVNAYISKPATFQALAGVMRQLAMFWLETAMLPEDRGRNHV